MENDVFDVEVKGWPLPDEYLIEIGRVVASWTALESLLEFCIGKLAGFEVLAGPKSFILVAHSSVPQKIDVLGALCENMLDEYPNLKSYKDVLARLRGSQKLRNKFIHNSISFDPENNNYVMAIGSARGKLKTSTEKINIKEIRRAALDMQRTMIHLYNLVLQTKLTPKWEED